ncbi:hypothetical protein FCT18_03275 [Lysinibacillus sphaericus]|uniref:Uncharacterized protein n=1 Tax=Lysinibacillus sphaericus TaxID=1421 RepID=A0A2S0JYG5_LYSSH|nr:hypothetical protein [Lysinibacillus sphaericus]AVK96175.1 hypothetical protein LS41612_07865 [Lysinibacillus sphaericus]MED4544544.1 hypothetical protein [Lysinibacillus sphaericus]TKI20671.1 hypothetical protein FCT18_03275 [Lysinibacillus sphaericus]SUV18063.1 Uncharacterised protein [Lysinibacillus sphaericus]GEC80701.1 hypothetical protein LSP03_04440 [Lysinibacillus sphaericus]
MEIRDWFSIPMILSQIVIWILWILLQLALEANVMWIVFYPFNFLFVANVIIGVVFKLKSVKRQRVNIRV